MSALQKRFARKIFITNFVVKVTPMGAVYHKGSTHLSPSPVMPAHPEAEAISMSRRQGIRNYISDGTGGSLKWLHTCFELAVTPRLLQCEIPQAPPSLPTTTGVYDEI
jgi:hypothetical protein